MRKCQEIVRQLQDEKQWLEQESKRQLEESERKLENVRAGELQELRRGKVEALQVLQVSSTFWVLFPDSFHYFYHICFGLYCQKAETARSDVSRDALMKVTRSGMSIKQSLVTGRTFAHHKPVPTYL